MTTEAINQGWVVGVECVYVERRGRPPPVLHHTMPHHTVLFDDSVFFIDTRR